MDINGNPDQLEMCKNIISKILNIISLFINGLKVLSKFTGSALHGDLYRHVTFNSFLAKYLAVLCLTYNT